MREIHVNTVIDAVEGLCIQANKHLPCSIKESLGQSLNKETSPLGKQVIGDLLDNMDAAKELDVPVCQDTGMAVVFMEVGQEVHIVGGLLEDAIEQGVRNGYINGMLRCSVVCDPLRRINTNDNTPAIIHTRIVKGDAIDITVAPKGFGSENMSTIKMFTPAATEDDIIEFVVDTVSKAGSNPCPPIVAGVGIGGDFEKCALLSKQALCRDIDIPNKNSHYAQLEQKMLQAVNALGIGPQGFGGRVTALAVNIEQYATHIAGLPVAVNMGCHVTRHASIRI